MRTEVLRIVVLALVAGACACGPEAGSRPAPPTETGEPPVRAGGSSGGGGQGGAPRLDASGGGGAVGGQGGSLPAPVDGGDPGSSQPPPVRDAGAADTNGAVADGGGKPQPGKGELGFEVPAESPPDVPLPACRREVAVAGDSALTAALAGLAPGDCVVLADGTYKAFKVTATGTAEAPIVIRARNRLGAVIGSGQLVLQGASHVVLEGLTIRTSGTMKFIDCRHCRLTRCKLALTVEDDWVLVYGANSERNRFDHNDIGPKASPGPFLVFGQEDTMSRYDRVDRNHFHDNGPPAVNEKESVRIGWSGVSRSDGFAVVEQNLFENCDGDPEIVSVKTNRNIVRHNTVRTSAGVLSLRHGNGSFLYGNVILGGGKSVPCKDRAGASTTCETGGIRIYGRDHRVFNNYIEGTTGTGHRAPLAIDGGDGTSLDAHAQIVGLQVVANTLVDNASGIEVGKNYSLPPLDVVVAYNLVRAPVGKVVQVFKPKATVTFTGNLFWAVGGGELGVALSAQEAGGVDPGLLRDGGLWRLSASSPAIDRAAPLQPFLTIDMDGQPRALPDVGADERSDAPVRFRPLTPTDVGPAAP